MRSSLRRLVAWALLPIGVPGALAAPTLGERLAGVEAAVEKHGASFAARPTRHARLAWLFIDADALPDALVVVKKEASDCAVHFASPTAHCMGFVLRGQPDGSFVPMAVFPYAGQIMHFGRRGGSGRVLLHTDRNQANPVYDRYAIVEGVYRLEQQVLPPREVDERSYLALSDRSMDRLADQRYALASFPANEHAALSPMRLHLDGVNARFRLRFVDKDANQVKADFAKAATEVSGTMIRDLASIVQKLGWTNQLDVRLWVCGDWMVPRRFWEVEGDQIGDVGTCLDPVVYWTDGDWAGVLKTSRQGAFDAMRVRLFQDIGIAFLLRGEHSSTQRIARLKQESSTGSARRQIIEHGSALGTLFAVGFGSLKAQTLIRTQEDWERLIEVWFAVIEHKGFGYPGPTPELEAFIEELHWRSQGMSCALEVLSSKAGAPGSSSGKCPSGLEEALRSFVAYAW